MTEASSSDSGNLAVLATALEAACVELMAAYGISASVQVVEVPSTPASPALVAAVDFSSRELFGTVSFRASRQVIEETRRHAPGMTGDTNLFLSDWTCELANQLVGRMKSKLREYELNFNVNPPRLLPKEDPSASEHAIHYRFVCACGSFTGYLDVVMRPGTRLERKSLPAGSPNEGDLVIL